MSTTTITAADLAAACEVMGCVWGGPVLSLGDIAAIVADAMQPRRAAADKMAEALTRMISATERYLQEQIPGDAQLYDPEYVSPLAQARTALAEYEAAK